MQLLEPLLESQVTLSVAPTENSFADQVAQMLMRWSPEQSSLG